jgi:hypothetical protein
MYTARSYLISWQPNIAPDSLIFLPYVQEIHCTIAEVPKSAQSYSTQMRARHQSSQSPLSPSMIRRFFSSNRWPSTLTSALSKGSNAKTTNRSSSLGPHPTPIPIVDRLSIDSEMEVFSSVHREDSDGERRRRRSFCLDIICADR